MERTVLHQQGSNGTAALIQLGLDHRTLSGTVRVGLQLLHFRYQQNGLQQFVNAHLRLGRHRHANHIAAPFLRHQFVLGKLLQHPIRVGALFIHLVNGNDNFNARCLGVVNGLNGLGHNAVVRSHNQHGNIRSHGTAGTHGGKGRVAGGVQEGDLFAVRFYLISADVLGNAAGLGRGHIRMTNGVQNGSLTMVNMAHHANYRRALHGILVVLVVLFNDLLLNGDHNLLLHLGTQFGSHDLCSIVVDHFVHAGHHAQTHQFFNHFGSRHTQQTCQFTHGDLLRHLNGDLLLFTLLRNAGQALGLRLSLGAGTHTLGPLFAVLLALLVELLLLLVIAHVGSRGNILVLLIVLFQIHIVHSGVHMASLAFGARLGRLIGLLLGLFLSPLSRLLRHLQNGSLALALLVLLRITGGLGLLLPFLLRRLALRLIGPQRIELVKILYAVGFGNAVKEGVQLPLLQYSGRRLLGRAALGQQIQNFFILYAETGSDIGYFYFYDHSFSSCCNNSSMRAAKPASSTVSTPAR